MLKKGDKIGLVCCSNGLKTECKEQIEQLNGIFNKMGLSPVWSDYIYRKDGVFSGTAGERAEVLMNFYCDAKIKAIFDISGGDIANEVLSYLDYQKIAENEKLFWGYSDLTTIINAIYAKSGKASVLYQVRNLLYDNGSVQRIDFEKTVMRNEKELFDFPYHFVRGDCLHGVVVGGNIRCLLKLAGTKYWPDMRGKVLFLEAFSTAAPQVVTYLNQLEQIGVYQQIEGILLGTFTSFEKNPHNMPIEDLVLQYVSENIPIVKTDKIGHGTDSKAIMIGQIIELRKEH